MNTVPLRRSADLFASIEPCRPTCAVSFCRLMKSLSSGKIMLRMACGKITCRIEVHCDRLSERAAATWLRKVVTRSRTCPTYTPSARVTAYGAVCSAIDSVCRCASGHHGLIRRIHR